MLERVRGYLGHNLADRMQIHTFHSLAARLLRLNFHRAGLSKEFQVIDPGDAQRLIQQILTQVKEEYRKTGIQVCFGSRQKAEPGVDNQCFVRCSFFCCYRYFSSPHLLLFPSPLVHIQCGSHCKPSCPFYTTTPHGSYKPYDAKAQTVQGQISTLKNLRNTQCTQEQKAKMDQINMRAADVIMQRYDKRLAEMNCVDFDDLLILCRRLLKAHPHCVSALEYITIDEFQDTNALQLDIMQSLAHAGNVMIVGDPDQSIYT